MDKIKVRIEKCDNEKAWYFYMVGDEIYVEDTSAGSYIADSVFEGRVGKGLISKSDCKVIN